jgi:hypothetical protein
MRWLVLALTLLLVLPWRLPPAWDPFAPLDLAAPPNLLTGFKLSRLEGEACRAALQAVGVSVTPVADQRSAEGCAVTDAVRPRDGLLSPAAPMMRCPLAAAWELYRRHDLDPAARSELGAGLRAVRHLGTYNCRNVNNAAQGRRSQHATANALDVAGFTLTDGREISVARDWNGPGPEAAFLRAARDGACRWFGAVLGPDYNAAHRDHFHLDRGWWQRCL